MVSQKGLVLGLLVLTVILGEMFSCSEPGSVEKHRCHHFLWFPRRTVAGTTVLCERSCGTWTCEGTIITVRAVDSHHFGAQEPFFSVTSP